MNTSFAIVLGLLLLMGLGYLAYTSYETPGAPQGSSESGVVPPAGAITIRGKLVCLPHQDTSGPQTLECAFGLQDEQGRYFGLRDTDPQYANVGSAPFGVLVEVRGTFTPEENDRYQGIGRIEVTGVEVLEVTNTLAGGQVSISHDDDVYGLAVRKEQILAQSYIPPCDDGFEYCIYRLGEEYEGTNFESAGVRISRRSDLATAERCLTMNPEGYSGLEPKVSTTSAYAAAVFTGIGEGAAGHYSEGEVYRLFTDRCYEFETRVGSSQFSNYPAGTIREFTARDREKVEGELRSIIGSVTLGENKTKVVFPR